MGTNFQILPLNFPTLTSSFHAAKQEYSTFLHQLFLHIAIKRRLRQNIHPLSPCPPKFKNIRNELAYHGLMI